MNAAEATETHKVYLGLGSNIAPEQNLPQAIDYLRQSITVIAISTAWETPPFGGKGPNFLNAAIQIETSLSPETLRAQVLRPIEARLGRVRSQDPNAPRPVDLDILIYDGVTLDADIWELAHLCIPLAELIPGYTHPHTAESISAVAYRLAHITPIYHRQDVNLSH